MTHESTPTTLGPFAFATMLLMMALLFPTSILAKVAEKPISDPTKWCADAVQLIADKKMDELLELLVASSRAPVTKQKLAQAYADLVFSKPDAGDFLYTVPVGEKSMRVHLHAIGI
jgi:hypothetical protein